MTTQPLLMPTRFEPPTMEMVREQAEKMGLSETEARAFWCFYESKDWFVGKNKMKKWICALAGWQLRCNSRNGSGDGQKMAKPVLTGADKMIYHEELKRCLAQIERIKAVDSHCDIRPEDRKRLGDLIARKKELKEMLGVKI